MEILVFLFRSSLSMDELMRISQERSKKFQKVEGLVQKFYVSHKESNKVGGVYIFDSKESLIAFRESDLSKSTAEAYKFIEPPEIKVLEVMKNLEEEEELVELVE
ncbi:MAG: YdhR family protein [Promethearchaeota archaeon]|jgi:hypothetical protein